MKRIKWTRKRLKALDEILRKNEMPNDEKARKFLAPFVDQHIAAKTKIK